MATDVFIMKLLLLTLAGLHWGHGEQFLIEEVASQTRLIQYMIMVTSKKTPVCNRVRVYLKK